MAEPRFQEAMETKYVKESGSGNSKSKIVDKKTMSLRLGYTQKPREKMEIRKNPVGPWCHGGNQSCKECQTGVNIISPEALLEGLEENPCKGSSCAACNECPGR